MPAEYKIAQQAMDNRNGRWMRWGRFAGVVCSCFVLLVLASAQVYINGAAAEFSLTLRAEAAFTTVTGHKPLGFGSEIRPALDCDSAGRDMPICQSKLR